MSVQETAKKLIFRGVEENDILIVLSDREKESFVNEILLHEVFRMNEVNLEVLNINKYRDEDAVVIHQELAKLTKQPYFPYVWVNGTYLGGECQTKRALQNGDLQYYLDL